MRIISQNGKVNVNYDNALLYIDDLKPILGFQQYGIVARTFGGDANRIGYYTTKEQCQEVFEEIITMGSSGMKVYRMPEDEGSGGDADACPIDR